MDKYLKIDIKPWERRWPGLIGILKAYLPCSCTGQMWIKIFASGFFLERKKKRKETGRETIFKNYQSIYISSLFIFIINFVQSSVDLHVFQAHSSNLRFTLKFERNRQDLDYPRFYQPC